MVAPGPDATRTLIDEYIAEQSRLQTPVARFSIAHDAGIRARLQPQLIPLTAPRPGEQYAFAVDLDSCTGCKSCVAACHSLNGLEDTETWRDVGLLISSDPEHAFSQTVTTACHHCADPACLNGCPVLAYEKDPVTGIVRHLDDQCIGCSYCILKCPYDVPKFSKRLGIVRKCDMCHSRLAEGEAPACVQACPTHAIRITVVSRTVSPEFLPAAPDPAYTQPTTRYTSRRDLPPTLIAADAAALRPQPSHAPLAAMLTLMSAAIGLSVADAVTTFTGPSGNHTGITVWAVAVGAVGLAVSVLHLGQPLRAWRIFLGWRKSWLSREAMLFGVWFPIAVAAIFDRRAAPIAAGVGLVALFCSVMIYVDTRRVFWRWRQTAPRVFGTAAVIGLASLAPLAAGIALSLKLAWESLVYVRAIDRRPARLLIAPLRRLAGARITIGATGALLLLATGLDPASAPLGLALVFCGVGELLERLTFFRAVDAPKMPGMPR